MVEDIRNDLQLDLPYLEVQGLLLSMHTCRSVSNSRPVLAHMLIIIWFHTRNCSTRWLVFKSNADFSFATTTYATMPGHIWVEWLSFDGDFLVMRILVCLFFLSSPDYALGETHWDDDDDNGSLNCVQFWFIWKYK